nr:hypothetical protein Iba_chr09aCG9170 [Ipomoea batatas]
MGLEHNKPFQQFLDGSSCYNVDILWLGGLLWEACEGLRCESTNSRHPDIEKKYQIQLALEVKVGLAHGHPGQNNEKLPTVVDCFQESGSKLCHHAGIAHVWTVKGVLASQGSV